MATTVPQLTPQQQQTALERTRQLFRFLKAYSARRTSLKRTLDEHEWSQKLRSLPDHPSIVIGEVLLNTGSNANDEGRGAALLTVRRPRLSDPPAPPAILVEWLVKGWQDPFHQPRTLPERPVKRNGATVVETFDEDPGRTRAIVEWRQEWETWAKAELPARHAMHAFEALYKLHNRIQLESERVELILGDGQLRWQKGNEYIDHPVLLQRVQMEFDPTVPELRIVDADRAPELYTALLERCEDLTPQRLNYLRRDLEQRGYHPLEREATNGFLTQLAQQLGPKGRFHKERSSSPANGDPQVERDPVLFLRAKVLGFADAFDRILQELEAEHAKIPISLVRLVGIEPAEEPDLVPPPHSPWGEPPDVLLSKPANAEQVAIARALERHRAVQVQGPPGTGKSHTIANIVGHLVANGKRVLVTSHTTKALRVLRQHIVEPIRPLAVAVLENDLEGRTQMKEAVIQILAKLSESPDKLAAEVEQLTKAREELNAAIDATSQQLQAARTAEYEPIVVGGVQYPPSEAARWVRDNKEGNEWIPGYVQSGAPLPLSGDELASLYATNSSIAVDEEDELTGGLPDLTELPNAEIFGKLVAQESDSSEGNVRRYWMAEPSELQIEELARLEKSLQDVSSELQRLASWEKEVVKAGYCGGTDVDLWKGLSTQIRSAHELWNQARPLLLEHGPELPSDQPASQLFATYEEIHAHVASGGSLGWLTLFTKSSWKKVVTTSRVNGQLPTQAVHFQALKAESEIREGRSKLKARWVRQAEHVGFPDFDSMGAEPEVMLLEYAKRIEERLESWRNWWQPVQVAMDSAGLDWEAVRGDAVAMGGLAHPFDRDADLIASTLLPLVSRRLAVSRARRAGRLLNDVQTRLARYTGRAASRVRSAIEARDTQSYASALSALDTLQGKRPLFERRRVLLDKIQKVAPQWAAEISTRQAPHDGQRVPGDASSAWLWRQLQQELERRSALDEQTLCRKLEQLQNELRRATSDLIERKAWQQQIARVDLNARQALQGWSDTQARIGRGTGRRVPELQAKARRLLEEAREAVPIWIMPLSRVAESFQSSNKRFDVVIVDEASQCDVVGLLGWYLGERLLVVGDDEQVSPLDVGQAMDATTALIQQHLEGIPNAHLYDGRTSIYNLAGQCFGGTIRLREHFRCMPAIIEFSNHLSYNGEIKALRNPSSAPKPHLVEYVVPPSLSRKRDGKRNIAEARMIACLLKAMTEHSAYAGKTFGAISLLADEQADSIQELALQLLGPVELAARRFAAGSPPQFQGDERDVMLLSMVDVPTGAPLPIRQDTSFKQRYNVAASRAKDQMWLVHSLDPAHDLKDGDLRRRLIEHVRDPDARSRKRRDAIERAESPFEEAVIKRLVDAGYAVTPQVRVGNYRIDIVVTSGQKEVAIECDGDRFHGVDQIPADMARQAILERAGWRFIRIRGTRFFRDPQGTMAWVRGELDRLGIQPGPGTPDSQKAAVINDIQVTIERRAWELMCEQGWVPAPPG